MYPYLVSNPGVGTLQHTFEAAYKAKYPDDIFPKLRINQTYSNPLIQEMWEGFCSGHTLLSDLGFKIERQ